jgi:steroid delta-isomerase-like uncharacterized protein
MTTEQNKAIVLRFLEAATAPDQTAFRETMSPDFMAHTQAYHDPLDREDFVKHNYSYHLMFSDAYFAIEDQVVEGDKVATRATYHGTHTGSFAGAPPTGKQIAISVFFIHRLNDGKIAEYWALFDTAGIMQQLAPQVAS